MNYTDYNRVHSYFKAMCRMAEEMDALNIPQNDDPNVYEEGTTNYQFASMRRHVNGEIKRARDRMLNY